jgi:hypothetical protein
MEQFEQFLADEAKRQDFYAYSFFQAVCAR